MASPLLPAAWKFIAQTKQLSFHRHFFMERKPVRMNGELLCRDWLNSKPPSPSLVKDTEQERMSCFTASPGPYLVKEAMTARDPFFPHFLPSLNTSWPWGEGCALVTQECGSDSQPVAIVLIKHILCLGKQGIILFWRNYFVKCHHLSLFNIHDLLPRCLVWLLIEKTVGNRAIIALCKNSLNQIESAALPFHALSALITVSECWLSRSGKFSQIYSKVFIPLL